MRETGKKGIYRDDKDNRMIRTITSALIFVLFLYSHAIAQPSSYDWRDVGGVNYVTPVRDMSPTAACWAFAATAALESKVLIAGLASREMLDLAEQVLLSCCVYCGGCVTGTASLGLDYIVATGSPTESCVPFLGASCKDYWDDPGGRCGENGITKCSTYQTQVYKVDSYTRILPVTVENLKSAIYNYGPVVVEYKICTDYRAWNGKGVYNYNGGGGCTSSHNALAVGWNDSGSYFITKDEYGTSYGEDGYILMGYSNVGTDVAFGSTSYRLGTASGPAAPNPAPNPPSNLRIIQ